MSERRSSLCISRKSGQGFWIGEAFMQVEQAGNGMIKVRINAPRNLPIRREELPPTITPITRGR